MTNFEIESELRKCTASERMIAKRVIELIAEALKRKIWLERGYENPHKWLVREYKYSDGSAARRLDAARLLLVAPEAADKIATGELTISSLAMAQSAFQKEERRTQAKISETLKQELVAKIGNLSCPSAERILAEEFPDSFRAPRESLRPAAGQMFSLTISLSQEQIASLQRSKELLSHSMPGATWAEIFTRLSEEHIQREDPIERAQRSEARQRARIQKAASSPRTEGQPRVRKTRIVLRKARTNAATTHSSAAAERAPINRILRIQVLARAQGMCEFVDSSSGLRCRGRNRVEVDHIVPRALGGRDEHSNLRCLCAAHNQLEASRKLGKKWATAWRTKTGVSSDSGRTTARDGSQ